MLQELLQKSNLFYLLFRIDCRFAEETRKQNCPFCGGKLHYSNYQRKPRGGPDLDDELLTRHSLCCCREGCRTRVLPPSCRFLDRKVYWAPVVLVVTALRQNRTKSASIDRLKRLYGITHNTIRCWIRYFKEEFPSSPRWLKIRGRIASSVRNDDLPGGLLRYFAGYSRSEEIGLVRCLEFLASG